LNNHSRNQWPNRAAYAAGGGHDSHQGVEVTALPCEIGAHGNGSHAEHAGADPVKCLQRHQHVWIVR